MSSLTIFFIIAVVLLLIGVPVAPTLALSAVAFILLEGIPATAIIQRLFSGVDVLVLMCIPFFMLAGDLMAKGGIAKRLVDVANLLVGDITGGLAYVTIIVCALFAAMTGSAMACCVTVGAIMIPVMDQAGYDRRFSAAVVAAGSVLGPIIPPSTAMIIYASSTNTSIAKLYLMGIPAGILIAVALGVVCFFYCKKMNYRGISKASSAGLKEGEKLSAKRVVKIVFGAIPALGSPVIILGFIFSGICTPTEASVVAVVYSFIIGLFVYRGFKIKDIPKVIFKSAQNAAKVMYIVACASLFAWVISYARVAVIVVDSLMKISTNPSVLMLIMVIILLIMGCIMEATPIMLITIPLFMPVCNAAGISLLHFGIVMCIAVCIGFVTPPFGTVLFTTMDVAKVTMSGLTRRLIPMIIVMLVMLFLIAFIPQLTMFIL